MKANMVSLHTPMTPGVGAKGHIFFSHTPTTPGSNFFSFLKVAHQIKVEEV